LELEGPRYHHLGNTPGVQIIKEVISSIKASVEKHISSVWSPPPSNSRRTRILLHPKNSNLEKFPEKRYLYAFLTQKLFFCIKIKVFLFKDIKTMPKPYLRVN